MLQLGDASILDPLQALQLSNQSLVLFLHVPQLLCCLLEPAAQHSHTTGPQCSAGTAAIVDVLFGRQSVVIMLI